MFYMLREYADEYMSMKIETPYAASCKYCSRNEYKYECALFSKASVGNLLEAKAPLKFAGNMRSASTCLP